MARKKPVSLSLSRVSDAIASLEADIRAAHGLAPFERKRVLAILSALDKLLHACCMKDGTNSDFIVASSAE